MPTTVFNSKKPNTFHYITMVAFRRVPIFQSEDACQILVDTLSETREQYRFKLVAYVIMPDHVHLIINPIGCDISLVAKAIKGKSAKNILKLLRTQNSQATVNAL